mmetsp:Transcript_48356/g.127975  ORF Transcript_48356/g.127975 Transcript_48356/m.127975 type:complete len:324 (-) Transcript_48356:970-1941(-)
MLPAQQRRPGFICRAKHLFGILEIPQFLIHHPQVVHGSDGLEIPIPEKRPPVPQRLLVHSLRLLELPTRPQAGPQVVHARQGVSMHQAQNLLSPGHSILEDGLRLTWPTLLLQQRREVVHARERVHVLSSETGCLQGRVHRLAQILLSLLQLSHRSQKDPQIVHGSKKLRVPRFASGQSSLQHLHISLLSLEILAPVLENQGIGTDRAQNISVCGSKPSCLHCHRLLVVFLRRIQFPQSIKGISQQAGRPREQQRAIAVQLNSASHQLRKLHLGILQRHPGPRPGILFEPATKSLQGLQRIGVQGAQHNLALFPRHLEQRASI